MISMASEASGWFGRRVLGFRKEPEYYS